MRTAINARCLLVVAFMCAGTWLAPPVIASEIKAGVRLPASTPVQPSAADQTSGFSIMMASVEYNGVLTYGIGVTSVTKPFNGLYLVTFERSIRSCAYMTAPAIGIQGFAVAGWSVVASANRPEANVLEVRTFSSADVMSDRYFQVQVTCFK